MSSQQQRQQLHQQYYDEDGAADAAEEDMMDMMDNHHQQDDNDEDDEDGQELNEEEIKQVIIQLGNDILKNVGVEEPVDDVEVFFSDEFYIQFFQAAFPEIDFSQLTPGQNEAEMAENIQALIDLLGEQILKYDLSHISGEEIVGGSAEHCINLLQLVQEIAVMIQNKGGVVGQSNGGQPIMASGTGSEEDDGGAIRDSQDDGTHPQSSHKKQNYMMPEGMYGDEDDGEGSHHQFVDHEDVQLEEDDEAQIIQQRRQSPGAPGPQQQQQRVRSNSADRRQQQQQQFQMDEHEDFDENEDISNEFHNNHLQQHHQMMNDEEDDEDLEQQFMQQLQNQPQIQKKIQRDHDEDDEDEDHSQGHPHHGGGDDEIDEDDIKMYEQFLANNKQQEQQLALNGGNNISNIGHEEDDGMIDIEDQQHDMMIMNEGAEDGIGMEGDDNGEDEDDDEEIDLDNIDYDQLDPQILEIAEQMGVHPKEVLKQIMQMNNNQDGEDEDEGEMDGQDEEDDDNLYGQEMNQQNDFDEQKAREEQLRREKELFKQQMMNGNKANPGSDSKKPAQPKQQDQKIQPSQAPQNRQQPVPQYQFENEYDDEDEVDQESYYSEGEIKTRIKLISQKSYSAPYLVVSDCYEEPLGGANSDDEDENQLPSKAYSTTVLQSLDAQQEQMLLQQQLKQQNEDDEDAEVDQETAQLLYQQQQKIMKKQEDSKKKQQQQQMFNDNDDEEELDVDISQRLMELQNNQNNAKQGGGSSAKQQQPRVQQQQYQNEQEEDEEQEGEGEDGDENDDEEEMMIDLDQLDDQNRQMLLEYLQQEYEKNPDQFPFPKEIIEDYMLKQQQQQQKQKQDNESVKDIKSQEMILEDVTGSNDNGQIVGGGQQIEEEGDEIHEDDDEGAEYLEDDVNQHQMIVDQYGQENADGEQDEEDDQIDIQQQQMLLQQQLMQQQMASAQQQRKSSKGKKGTQGNLKRPKSGNAKKKANLPQNMYQQQMIQEQNEQDQLQQIPQDQLQQLIQLLQNQEIDLENVDPNIIQQLLMVQQQQQMAPPQMLVSQQPRARPATAGKRKTSGSKKRTTAPGKSAKNLQAYQMQQRQSIQNKSKTIQYSERAGSAGKKKSLVKKSKVATLGKQRPQTAGQRQNRMPLHQQQQHFQQMTPQQQQEMLLYHQQQQQQQLMQMQHDDQGVIQEEDEEDLLQSQQNLQQQQQEVMQNQSQHEEDDDEEEDNVHSTLQPQLQQHQQLLDIPNFSEEFLNQLSEEQLEQLLIQQQQLMLMQQQQQQYAAAPPMQPQRSLPAARSRSSKKSRPKSAKVGSAFRSLKPPSQPKTPGFSVYVQQPQKKLAPSTKIPAKKKKGVKKSLKNNRMPQYIQQDQGVLMNNFFPALEGGINPNSGSDSEYPSQKDQLYPKFSLDNLNGPQNPNPNMVVQDQIDEVPQEQEEAESQENIQAAQFYQQQLNQNNMKNNDQEDDEAVVVEDGNNDMQDQDEANPHDQMQQDEDAQQLDGDETAGAPGIELSDEQLIELIKNAHALSPEQQQQLQVILQQRMKAEMVNERAQSYQNIYQILMDNVKRAKDRLAPLGQVSIRVDDSQETDRRILRQKQEFEALYRQYQNELKAREARKKDEDNKIERRIAREQRIQTIRERKFQDELQQHQKSLNYKRNAQQVKLCQKVYKLASELEKNKLLQEKKEFKENQERKRVQNRLMVDAIETYYKNQIQLLKERIESERFERRVAQQAQQQALARMKRELNDQKRREVERYLQLLRQEDERYEFESGDVGRIEQEIVKMYKKGK